MNNLSTYFKFKLSAKPKTPEEMEEYSHTNEIIPKLMEGGFPPRYHQRFPNGLNCIHQQTALDACRKVLRKQGAIVVLAGIRGSGKTTIAALLAQDRAKNGKVTPYRKMLGLLERFKPLYSSYGSIDSESIATTRDTLCSNQDLLIIDEVHEADNDPRMHDLKDRVLTDIIDRRYANLKDTLLITNHPVETISTRVNDSILSRIKEHGQIIPCNWHSFR